MKVLISACVVGNPVRWNTSARHHEFVTTWAKENGIELVPVCPEARLLGIPKKRSTIHLRRFLAKFLMNTLMPAASLGWQTLRPVECLQVSKREGQPFEGLCTEWQKSRHVRSISLKTRQEGKAS